MSYRSAPGFIIVWLVLVALGCAQDSVPTGGGERSPSAGEDTEALMFELTGADIQGAPSTLQLGSPLRVEPLLAETEAWRGAELVMVVVHGGLWCGTCRWYAEHADEAVPSDAAERVARIDMIVGDRENAPAGRTDAVAWQEAFYPGSSAAVYADPELRFVQTLRASHGEQVSSIPAITQLGPLPWVFLFDATTSQLVSRHADPEPSDIAKAVGDQLELPATVQGNAPLIDGRFTAKQWELLSDARLQGSAHLGASTSSGPGSTDPGGVAAVALGRALFFDGGLSARGDVACSTCHEPELAFGDDQPVAIGEGLGHRRAPSILFAKSSPRLFWDGRASDLATQALEPLTDPQEMNSSRVHVARRVLSVHRGAYRAAFGDDAPELRAEAAGWPLHGNPGDAAYETLPALDRQHVDALFTRVGEALAAFERSLSAAPNRFDAYVAGDPGALTDEEKYGLSMFVEKGCMQCHWGPRLTDDAFHDVGFGAFEPMHDRPSSVDVDPGRNGKFKTPPLRGVAHGKFFGHDGRFSELAEVMLAYGSPTSASTLPGGSSSGREPWVLTFGETVQWGLVPFLRVLTAPPSER